MRKVELSYSLAASRGAPGGLHNPLVRLLDAVHGAGSISAAARTLGLSYRHVWGELRRWEAELGQSLVVWDKGQPALLTPFATKLLWAERQAQARLAPQVQALQAELERVFAVAFAPGTQVLTLYASHDEGLTRLREHAATHATLHLDIRFCGSVDAIAALNEGRCTLAGFHVREGVGTGAQAQAAYQPLLQPGAHKLLGFARRTQGLVVATGNPLGLHTLADVAAKGARFAQRALGSGTRVLQDELLAEHGGAGTALVVGAADEPSHGAVAQAVAAGAADAGLAIEAAAAALGLGFVPLVHEHYLLVCLKDALDTPPTAALRGVLESAAWQAELGSIAGYAPWRPGEVLSLTQELPWWNLPPKRVRMRRSGNR